jgi:flagellar biosynthesis chaperone FliJ
MDDLKALKEIEGIRISRVERAEDELRKAQAIVVQRQNELQQAQIALENYVKELPALIEALYTDCIGYIVSRAFVQDKVAEEALLRAKVEDFKHQVEEARQALKKAEDAVQEAQDNLNREKRKLDALGELIGEIKKGVAIERGRAEAKVIDELASSKFVRNRAKAKGLA